MATASPQLADPVFAQDGPVGDSHFEPVGALDVFGGHDADHAGHALGDGRVDARDDCVVMFGAPDHGHFQGAGDPDVGGERGRAASFDHGRRAGVGYADDALRRVGPNGVGGGFAAQEPAGEPNRFDDPVVPGAAA